MGAHALLADTPHITVTLQRVRPSNQNPPEPVAQNKRGALQPPAEQTSPVPFTSTLKFACGIRQERSGDGTLRRRPR